MQNSIRPDVVDAALSARLHYVSDETPGFTRKREGSAFVYLDTEGRRIKSRTTLRRIAALAIPPAYTDVWISPHENSHIQATGRDARGRKQYRYHPRWREVRDDNKYSRMLAFGEALPKIRRHVARDLALPGMPLKKVLATLVRLLETTHIRVGNEEYRRTNQSFGLTTLRNRHVEVKGSTLRFEFKGKGGKLHNIAVEDPRVARIVRQCLEIPGQHLFQYLDAEGQRHSVTSSNLNDYLHDIAGEEFTAKDFRTWAGTLLAARELRSIEPAANATQAKQNVVDAIRRTAQRLGNTAAICKKCYVHPEVLRSYLNERSASFWKRRAGSQNSHRMEEKDLLKYLKAIHLAEKRLLRLQ
jgi:DNA topoisomerase-1